MKSVNEEVIEMLKKSDALISDSHIVYTSGKHGSFYINKDALYPHTNYSSRIGELFAETHKDLDIDVVCAPALGGIILSQWTAHHLSKIKQKEILAVYTEKDKGSASSGAESGQIFKRGYDKFIKGKRVLILEDLTNTGGSVLKVVDAVRTNDGEVAAVSVMANRNPTAVNSEMFNAPFSSLATIPAEAWDAEECPLCKENVPINTKVGHGKKFLEERGKK